MDKEQFSRLLIEQQNKGKALLSLISNMRESRNDFGDGMVLMGGEDLYYVPEDELDEFTNKFEGWKSYVLELLETQFGGDDQFVYEWSNKVVTYVSKREPILQQLKKNVNKGLSLIDSFLERLDIHYCEKGFVEEILKQDNMVKTPMVFISHSSKDKAFAEALVVLLEDLGMDSSNVFCSSVDGYGVGLSQDIFETLRNLFNEHDLFVIFIHSPRYYNSAVSLNEMGAAWVLKTDFCSFLTTDMSFSDMTGVINQSKMSIKVDSSEASSQLAELKKILIQTFGLNSIDETKWDRKRKAFFDKVTNLQYPKEHKQEFQSAVILNDNEIEILKKWVNSGDMVTYQMNYIGNRTEYYLGSNGYEAKNSAEKAEWEDFFERLQTLGYVTIKGYDKSNNPQYKLKKAAFDYIKTLSDRSYEKAEAEDQGGKR